MHHRELRTPGLLSFFWQTPNVRTGFPVSCTLVSVDLSRKENQKMVRGMHNIQSMTWPSGSQEGLGLPGLGGGKTGPRRTQHTPTPGWWFGTFFIFPHIGNHHPNWLIFFTGVQTTNQTLWRVSPRGNSIGMTLGDSKPPSIFQPCRSPLGNPSVFFWLAPGLWLDLADFWLLEQWESTIKLNTWLV